MSLSYHFTLTAPACKTVAELETFLKSVEADAKAMGFKPTMVLNAEFDTPERQEFAKRTVRGLHVEDERLRGVVLPDERQVWNFSPSMGHCRVAPERAVLLVLTDQGGCETVFGFAWYPVALRDIHGKELVQVPEGGKWFFRDFVDSGDPRYRQIVKRFAGAGYVAEERDEFVKVKF